MMVGVGGGLLFAILVAMLVFNKKEFMVEVENTSLEPINNMVVKINGEAYPLGSFRDNEMKGDHVRCTPGNDIELEYDAPNLGHRIKKLPKKSVDGLDTAPDFANFKGVIRIRMQADGIHETEY